MLYIKHFEILHENDCLFLQFYCTVKRKRTYDKTHTYHWPIIHIIKQLHPNLLKLILYYYYTHSLHPPYFALTERVLEERSRLGHICGNWTLWQLFLSFSKVLSLFSSSQVGLDIKRTGWQQCRMPLGICSVSCCQNTGQRVREAVGGIDWIVFQVQNNLERNTQLSDVDYTPYNSRVFFPAGLCLLAGQCTYEASVFVSVCGTWNTARSHICHVFYYLPLALLLAGHVAPFIFHMTAFLSLRALMVGPAADLKAIKHRTFCKTWGHSCQPEALSHLGRKLW